MRQVLEPFLARQDVIVLDGGLATELERRGESLDDRLWSASVLLERPQRIAEVHAAYLEAGADCIIGASYQASFEGFAAQGLSEERAETMLRRSVRLAVEARERFWHQRASDDARLRPLVAASIGPYGAVLADGSEYRGDYGLAVGELIAFHRRRLEVLADTEADLLACETIPSLAEAEALVELLETGEGPPAWMSFSCRDGAHLWDGTPLIKAVESVRGGERIVAVGVNCTEPRWVTSLLRAASRLTSKPLVAYPNSGERWDARRKRWVSEGQSDLLLDRCRTWRDAGARLIGGCCRVGPTQIGRLRAELLGSGGQESAPAPPDRSR